MSTAVVEERGILTSIGPAGGMWEHTVHSKVSEKYIN